MLLMKDKIQEFINIGSFDFDYLFELVKKSENYDKEYYYQGRKISLLEYILLNDKQVFYNFLSSFKFNLDTYLPFNVISLLNDFECKKFIINLVYYGYIIEKTNDKNLNILDILILNNRNELYYEILSVLKTKYFIKKEKLN